MTHIHGCSNTNYNGPTMASTAVVAGGTAIAAASLKSVSSKINNLPTKKWGKKLIKTDEIQINAKKGIKKELETASKKTIRFMRNLPGNSINQLGKGLKAATKLLKKIPVAKTVGIVAGLHLVTKSVEALATKNNCNCEHKS